MSEVTVLGLDSVEKRIADAKLFKGGHPGRIARINMFDQSLDSSCLSTKQETGE